MNTLKRTVLFNEHLKSKATMVDFSGTEMPLNYPSGIVEEHLYTRKRPACLMFLIWDDL